MLRKKNEKEPEYIEEEDDIGGNGEEARQVEDPLHPLLNIDLVRL